MTCKFCDSPTVGGSNTCDACWEVTSRLEKFVESEKGFDYVMSILINHLGSVVPDELQQTINDMKEVPV